MVIEGDFVPKGVEQFDHSSQDPDLEYNNSVLLLQEQPILVVLVEKRKGE
jgi:hypothetical protein